jgi:hypothetical protein
MAPSSDEPNQGLDYDLGESLRDWTTRWSQIEEDRDDDAAAALVEATGLLDEIARERGIETEGPAAPETEDYPRAMEALRDLASRYERDEPIANEEIDDGFVSAREIFDLLVGDRDDAEAGP